ncbi:MAG: hypothetical protein ACI3YC_04400 [Alloprevotella sp.]
MKQLLETYLGKHFDSTKRVIAISEILKGTFLLSDSKACADCKVRTPEHEAGCDKVVLKCYSEREVGIVNLEEFLSHFSHLKKMPSGEKCDLLLFSESKIVFCEMTCSSSRYVDDFTKKDGTEKTGKRNVARKQLSNSIETLSAVPEIAAEIAQKKEKIALFAFREKTEPRKQSIDASIVENIRRFRAVEVKVRQKSMFTEINNDPLAELKTT